MQIPRRRRPDGEEEAVDLPERAEHVPDETRHRHGGR
jgi:hypothetical protein